MNKPMTTDYVKRNTRDFFIDRKAILLEPYENMFDKSIFINAGSIVTIKHKNYRYPGRLDVKCDSSGVEFDRILPDFLELIKDKGIVNYNAYDTWLEPYIGWEFHFVHVTKNYVWFYMDYGDKLVKQKELRERFDIN